MHIGGGVGPPGRGGDRAGPHIVVQPGTRAYGAAQVAQGLYDRREPAPVYLYEITLSRGRAPKARGGWPLFTE